MSLQRLALLFFFLFSLAACSASDHNSDTVNPDTDNSRVNVSAIPSTYSELAEFTLTVAELQSDYQDMMAAQEHTFENTVKGFNDLYAQGLRIRAVLNYIQISVPDAEMRALAAGVSLQLTTWFFQIVTDSALHDVMQDFVDRNEEYDASEQEVITSVESLLTGYGMGMDDADRNTLNALDIQSETLAQQIRYLNLAGDPEDLIPGLLSNLIKGQNSSANLIGYNNYADNVISSQMPGSAENVESFLLEALAGLHSPFDALIEKLRVIKSDIKDNPDAVVYYEDRLVYLDKLIDKEYGISGLAAKYSSDGIFPLEEVIDTLFSLYDNYFGIELIKTAPPGNVWHEDVEYYELRNKETGTPLGTVYLDLLARDGKQNSSMIYKLVSAYTDENGTNIKPVFVWHMSINSNAEGGTVMVPVAKTLSMFHEFGHLLQQSLSSVGVSSEFIEVFSQLFEEYFYEREVFDSLSGDGASWTDAEYNSWMSVIALKELDQKVFSFASYLFNLKLYTDFSAGEDIDVLALQDDILNAYFLPVYYDSTQVVNVMNQTNSPVSLYRYGWSLGIALDVADYVRKNGGLMNQANARMLRDKFYTLEAPLDKNGVVRSFLGRDWNMDAFYEYYGAGVEE